MIFEQPRITHHTTYIKIIKAVILIGICFSLLRRNQYHKKITIIIIAEIITTNKKNDDC